jgi:hypothetical protein
MAVGSACFVPWGRATGMTKRSGIRQTENWRRITIARRIQEHVKGASQMKNLETPVTQILIKGKCTSKHERHVLDAGHIPLVQGLVEGGSIIKHAIHSFDLSNVPLVQGLVEGDSTIKHVRCVNDA